MASSSRLLYVLGIILGVIIASIGLYVALRRNSDSVDNANHDQSVNRFSVQSLKSGKSKRPNVVFVIADDLKALFGPYLEKHSPDKDHSLIHTPHLNQLAGRSLVLKNAYVQQAICGPSRSSFLTGRRPDTTHVYDLRTYWRDAGGNYTTIPQYFKEHGYRTAGFGKVFHGGVASNNNDPISWTEPYIDYAESKFWNDRTKSWRLAADDAAVASLPLQDMRNTEEATRKLTELSKSDQPFFLALGLHRPHEPFVAPKKYYDLYPIRKLHLPVNSYAPVDMPEIAWSSSILFRSDDLISQSTGGKWYGAINDTLPDKSILEIRQAYYACISYIDSLVGKIINHLKRLNIDQNTIVVLSSDHGFSLGENGFFGKLTVFETSTRTPLMFHIPGLTDTGVVSEQLVEFTDIFPTLAEAAGLPPVELCPPDSTHVKVCSEGVSFLPLVDDNRRAWKRAVFSQYPRLARNNVIVMGYTVRTHRYRYTNWLETEECGTKPVWDGKSQGEELYDLRVDPQENVNVVAHKRYESVHFEMKELLQSGWRKSLPLKY